MKGSPELLCARAGRTARLALDQLQEPPEDVAGALVVFCAGCMLAIQDRMDSVAAEVKNAIPGIPFLGFFTFGEQGTGGPMGSVHGNLMISATLFAAS
jgi:hypothetical protein